MIVLVPAPLAESLSRALWDLARPAAIRVGDVTQQMFGWIEDLQSPRQRWLEVDTEFSIPVHAEAEMGGIAGILQPFIDAGHLPADTNATLAVFIESKRGQRLAVYEAFPQFFKDQAKTRDQMISAGLLNKPELPKT